MLQAPTSGTWLIKINILCLILNWKGKPLCKSELSAMPSLSLIIIVTIAIKNDKISLSFIVSCEIKGSTKIELT